MINQELLCRKSAATFTTGNPANSSIIQTSPADDAVIATILEIFDTSTARQKYWLRQTLLGLLSSDKDYLLPVIKRLKEGRTITAAETLCELADRRGGEARRNCGATAELYRHSAALFMPILEARAVSLLKKSLCSFFACSSTHHMLADYYMRIGRVNMAHQHLIHVDRQNKGKQDKGKQDNAENSRATPPIVFSKSFSNAQNLSIMPLCFSQSQTLTPLQYTGTARKA